MRDIFALGRFISADTIVPDGKNPQSLNRFSYTRNNPLKYIDPTGHRETDGCDYEGCSATQNDLDKAIGNAERAKAQKFYRDCANGGGAGCPNPVELTAFFLGGMALSALATPEMVGAFLDKIGIGAATTASTASTAACGDGDCTNEARAGLNWLQRLAADCSFSADTLVATENGERPISTIQVGDQVLAYNEFMRAIGAYTVTAVLVHLDPTIVFVTIDGERIETTPEHPFFTQESGWVPAGKLWSGAHAHNADSEYSVVQSVEFVHRQQPMYNLTVAGAHTF